MAETKKYQVKHRHVVEAYQTPIPAEVRTSEGTRYAQKGEWVVTHPDGYQSISSDADFKEIYEPLPDQKTSDSGPSSGKTPSKT